jgi:tetratricopeptide (TPR) repeat protein
LRTQSVVAVAASATPHRRRLPRRVALVAAAAVVVTAAVVAGLMVRTRLGGSGAADPERVLVVPFENLTGDRTLDPAGRLAHEAVTGGLAELELVEITEPEHARVGGGAGDGLLELAAEKRAGTIVTGSYSLRADTLELRARLLSVPGGDLLFALEPAAGPRSNPAEAVEALKQRVKGAIAYQFGPMPSAYVGRPVPYEAYREFVTAMGSTGFDLDAALVHMERAVEIAPDFWMARLRLVTTYTVLRQPAKAREMFASVEKATAQLSPTELLHFRFVKARRDGKRLDALKAANELLALAPHDPLVSMTAGHLALSLNRPRAALGALGDLSEIDWRVVGKWPQGEWYIRYSAQAHHYLGEYREELADAQLGVRYYPNSQQAYESLVRAFAALGRLDEVDRVIAMSLMVPPDSQGSPGTVMLTAVQELRVHGHPEEAIQIALRCDRWYQDHRPTEAEGKISTANRAEIFWVLQRWPEARAAAEQYARDDPGSFHAPGLLGLMAARAGDLKVAAECDAKLAAIEQPAKGYALGWRAVLAAQRGEKERAVELLRDAFAAGMPFDPYVHARVYLEPLQGYPPFEELLKPKG